MKKKTVIGLTVSIVLIIFLFYYIHGTPERALRTAIFGTGEFSRAFTCKLTLVIDSNDVQIYKVSPPYHDEATNTIFEEYQVEKSKLNYYIAGYHFEN